MRLWARSSTPRCVVPNAQIDACDLDKNGVAFCERTFGVKGIVSDPDLTKALLPGSYDLIRVGSPFTHLPQDITGRCYETVWYISEDKWVKIVSECRASGYGYASYSRQENHDFIDGDYGVSMALPSATINGIGNVSGVRIYG